VQYEQASFMWQAADMNPFQTDFFTWIDIDYLQDDIFNGVHLLQYTPLDVDGDTVLVPVVSDDEYMYSLFSTTTVSGTYAAHQLWHNTYYQLFQVYTVDCYFHVYICHTTFTDEILNRSMSRPRARGCTMIMP
jgi:hypothetical protein